MIALLFALLYIVGGISSANILYFMSKQYGGRPLHWRIRTAAALWPLGLVLLGAALTVEAAAEWVQRYLRRYRFQRQHQSAWPL